MRAEALTQFKFAIGARLSKIERGKIVPLSGTWDSGTSGTVAK